MKTFIYYLPGVPFQDVTLDMLRESNLHGALRDCLESGATFGARVASRAVHANGPDGMSGTIVGTKEAGDGIGYYPARQTWQQINKKWIGYEDLPTPSDLARPKQLAGYERELNGQAWNIPTVRRGGLKPMLPRKMGLAPDGSFSMEVRDSWRWAWDLSGEMWDCLVHPDKSITFERAFSIASEALAINYRVGPEEMTILGSLDTDNWEEVFRCVCDVPFIAEWEEQNNPNAETPVPLEAGEPSSTHGVAA